jgi:hypothetical protein
MIKINPALSIIRILCFCAIICLNGASCFCNVIGGNADGGDKPEKDGIDAFYSPEQAGPCTFSIQIINSEFPAYMPDVKEIYLRIPDNSSEGSMPVIIVEPGFFAHTTGLDDVAEYYASHGYIVLSVTNLSQFDLITTTSTVITSFRLHS